MKARVKATGNIVDVKWFAHNSSGAIYADSTHSSKYYEHELDFDTVYNYWEKLKHQAAISAMQVLIAEYRNTQGKYGLSENLIQETCAKESIEFATALVEKLKNE